MISGVVVAAGRDQYSLGHLSFQEFLAANAIMRSQKVDVLAEHFSDPWWHGVLVFYAGLCGDVTALLDRVQEVRPLSRDDGLIQEMLQEARLTPNLVTDFLRQGADSPEETDRDYEAPRSDEKKEQLGMRGT